MSVASTKAFYAQVAGGALLACAISEAAGLGSVKRRDALLRALRSIPDAMLDGDRQARHDRRRGATLRPGEAVLGGRRQRAQPGGRRGDPDQAQRALLQVDRLRRHRGQEAHRSVVGTADHRVRGGAAGEHRRRRRQGDRDLPGPQGDADRGGRRGRHAVRVGGDDLRSRTSTRPSASSCRRWSATSSGTRRRSRSTPRHGRCARRARRSSEPSPPDPTATRCSSRSPPACRRWSIATSMRSAAATTTATSRPAPRFDCRGCSAT